MPSTDACPCTSGLPYKSCCRPYHRREREAPTPEALMRSRFAAFARKDAAYLLHTLHASHPDRNKPEAELLLALRTTTAAFRYLGLSILDQRPPDAEGRAQVLFYARIFEKGRDRSFVELSDFFHDGVGWRYRDGRILAAADVAGDPRALDIERFLAIAG